MTIRTLLIALPLLFVGWIAVMAVVMLLSDAAPGAVVFFPAADFLSQVPQDTAILSRGAVTITVQSDAPGLGLSLYRAGGLLVLPAGLTGCLPLPTAPG